MTKETNNGVNITHSSLTAKVLLRGFKELSSGTIVADIAIMSGKGGDRQRYLSGGLVVSKSLTWLAKTQLNVDYGNSGIVANAVITDLYAESNPSQDGKKHYINYRGFLNSISFG